MKHDAGPQKTKTTRRGGLSIIRGLIAPKLRLVASFLWKDWRRG